MESGIYEPPIRSFMDDFTVSKTTHTHVRLILSAWEGSISWTRMKIKANKYKEGACGQATQDVDSKKGGPINSRKPNQMLGGNGLRIPHRQGEHRIHK